MKAQILTIPVKAWGKIGQCHRRLFHIFAYLALLSYLGFQHFCIIDRWSLCFEDISNSWVSSCLHSKAWLNYSIWTENNFRGGCHFANLKVWSNNLLVVPLPWGETIIEVPMWIYKLKIIFVGAAIFFLRAVECTAVMIYCYIQSIPLFCELRQRSILKSCVINDCWKTTLNFIWVVLPEYFRCYSCLLCDFQRISRRLLLIDFWGISSTLRALTYGSAVFLMGKATLIPRLCWVSTTLFTLVALRGQPIPISSFNISPWLCAVELG